MPFLYVSLLHLPALSTGSIQDHRSTSHLLLFSGASDENYSQLRRDSLPPFMKVDISETVNYQQELLTPQMIGRSLDHQNMQDTFFGVGERRGWRMVLTKSELS